MRALSRDKPLCCNFIVNKLEMGREKAVCARKFNTPTVRDRIPCDEADQFWK